MNLFSWLGGSKKQEPPAEPILGRGLFRLVLESYTLMGGYSEDNVHIEVGELERTSGGYSRIIALSTKGFPTTSKFTLRQINNCIPTWISPDLVRWVE